MKRSHLVVCALVGAAVLYYTVLHATPGSVFYTSWSQGTMAMGTVRGGSYVVTKSGINTGIRRTTFAGAA